MFPLTVSIGNASLTLNADGSATGDLAAFGAVLGTLQGPPDEGAVTAWLILHYLSTLTA